MMNRIMTRRTVATLAAWFLFAQTGQCFYNPSTGRWLSRDPIASDLAFATQQANLVEELDSAEGRTVDPLTFLANDPIAKTDKLGLWGAADHDLQTYVAWLPVQYANPSPCAGALWALVVKANLEQDAPYMFSEARHYNRPPWKSRRKGIASYRRYVDQELNNYDQALQTPSKENCRSAAVALGHVTHSWQDFFAHGKSAQYKWKAWENNAGGTPDAMGDSFPSAWPGQHPPVWEPRLGEPERGKRKAASTTYTQQQYAAMLPRLLKTCQCYCK